VLLFAFGKYGERYEVETPSDPKLLQPFSRKTYREADFDEQSVRVEVDPDALPEFIESLDRIENSHIAEKVLV
jgi:hypothetical protein